MDTDKVIIVEGLSDKKKIKSILKESIEIICTNGTISHNQMEELIELLENKEVYVLVDADSSGEKLRKQLKREFPFAHHLYIDRTYKEVAATPSHDLAAILLKANLDVYMDYKNKG